MNRSCQILQERISNLRQQFEDLELRRSICEELSQSPVPDEAAAGQKCLDNVGRRANDIYLRMRSLERELERSEEHTSELQSH